MDPLVTFTYQGAKLTWLCPADWPQERIEWFFEGLALRVSAEEMEILRGRERGT
jgi:hypothetical protein